MRNLKLLFILLLSVSASSLVAQEELKEATLTYEITDISSDDPTVNQQLAMMKGSTMSILLMEGQQLTEMSMMNDMIKQKMLMDVETGNMDMYMDAMGQKFKVNIPSSKTEEAEAKPNIKYFKDDRKQIAGYDAYKAIISTEQEGQSMKLTTYITEDLKFDGNIIRNMPGTDQLKGMPLEYTVNQPQMSMTFTATKVSPEVDASAFEFDKTGYKEMTKEQLEQMGGGMGF
jgi:hypothetical protein